jgi:hypothetical protein
MLSRAFPDAVTVVDTAAMYELGTEWYMDAAEAEALDSTVQGPQVWVYVFNDEASASFVEGTIVAFDAGTANFDGRIAPTGTATAALIGVAQHTIAAGSYGWILKRGFGEVLADTGGITADTALVVGNAVAGRADDVAASTDHAFAVATESALATALATCYIRIP